MRRTDAGGGWVSPDRNGADGLVAIRRPRCSTVGTEEQGVFRTRCWCHSAVAAALQSATSDDESTQHEYAESAIMSGGGSSLFPPSERRFDPGHTLALARGLPRGRSRKPAGSKKGGREAGRRVQLVLG